MCLVFYVSVDLVPVPKCPQDTLAPVPKCRDTLQTCRSVLGPNCLCSLGLRSELGLKVWVIFSFCRNSAISGILCIPDLYSALTLSLDLEPENVNGHL